MPVAGAGEGVCQGIGGGVVGQAAVVAFFDIDIALALALPSVLRNVNGIAGQIDGLGLLCRVLGRARRLVAGTDDVGFAEKFLFPAAEDKVFARAGRLGYLYVEIGRSDVAVRVGGLQGKSKVGGDV